MHFYEFNIGDFAKKTQHLTNEEELAYRRALDLYYDTENQLDTQDLVKLSRRLRVNVDALKNVMDEFFPDGKNRHADEKIAAYHAFLNKQKANGIKGGRPKKNPTVSQGNPMPSQTLTNNQEPKNQEIIIKPRSNASIEKPDDIEQSVWDDFLAIRKAKRSPLTNTALIAIEREAEKAGWCMQQALQECVARGWQGFKADWVIKNNFNKQESLEIRNRKVVEQYNAELRAKGEI